MRALAVEVKRRAATESLGTVRRRLSSVTVPITTIVLPWWDSVTFEAMRESETGGRLIRDMKRRRNTTLLKFDSVRPIICELALKCPLSPNRQMFKIGHTGKEAVELHQNLQVDILAFRRFAMGAAHMVAVQVDTYLSADNQQDSLE